MYYQKCIRPYNHVIQLYRDIRGEYYAVYGSLGEPNYMPKHAKVRAFKINCKPAQERSQS